MLQRGEARAGQYSEREGACVHSSNSGRAHIRAATTAKGCMYVQATARGRVCAAAMGKAATELQLQQGEPATATAGAAAAAALVADAVGAVGCTYQGRSEGMAKRRAGDHKKGPGSANEGQGA